MKFPILALITFVAAEVFKERAVDDDDEIMPQVCVEGTEAPSSTSPSVFLTSSEATFTSTRTTIPVMPTRASTTPKPTTEYDDYYDYRWTIRQCIRVYKGRYFAGQDQEEADEACKQACIHVHENRWDYGCTPWLEFNAGGKGLELLECVNRHYGDICYDVRFEQYNLIIRDATDLNRGLKKREFFNKNPWYETYPPEQQKIILKLIDQVLEERKLYGDDDVTEEDEDEE